MMNLSRSCCALPVPWNFVYKKPGWAILQSKFWRINFNLSGIALSAENLRKLVSDDSTDSLILSYCALNDDVVDGWIWEHLLEELDLSHNPLSDKALAQFLKSGQARHLNLSGTGVGEQTLQMFAESLDQSSSILEDALNQFELNDVELSDAAFASLAAIKTVVGLSLDRSNIRAEHLDDFAAAEGLCILSLRETALGDEAEVPLVALAEQGKFLDIRETRVGPEVERRIIMAWGKGRVWSDGGPWNYEELRAFYYDVFE
jgi:hypothetical protein